MAQSTTDAPALSIVGLSKTFGANTVLRNVALNVRVGEIHGLLGENGSGKSTLIKVLAGFHEPDPGADVRIWDKAVSFPLRPGAFRALGLSFVHQDLALVSEISILENLFVSEIVSGSRKRTRRQTYAEAGAIMQAYGISGRPEDPVSRLGPSDRSRLAIARSLREVSSDGNARHVLVLDEPTNAMSLADKRALYSTFKALARAGHALLLVSHDLDEILEVTDTATVLRDGVGASVATRSVSPGDLVRMIVGHSVNAVTRRDAREQGAQRITVKELRSPNLDAVSFEVCSGEIVGFTGLLGSGYDKLNKTIYGAEQGASGRLRLGETEIEIARHNPAQSVRLSMGLVPLERDRGGVATDLSVTDNLAAQLLDLPEMRSFGPFISRRKIQQRSREAVNSYRIKAPAVSAMLKTLSGGNRQKVLLAKWLVAGVSVLLLDEPTQAVDIGAHADILDVLDGFARAGGSVLISSADWEQLAAICDRVLVFGGGTVKAELPAAELTKHAIGEACYRFGSRQSQIRIGNGG